MQNCQCEDSSACDSQIFCEKCFGSAQIVASLANFLTKKIVRGLNDSVIFSIWNATEFKGYGMERGICLEFR